MTTIFVKTLHPALPAMEAYDRAKYRRRYLVGAGLLKSEPCCECGDSAGCYVVAVNPIKQTANIEWYCPGCATDAGVRYINTLDVKKMVTV